MKKKVVIRLQGGLGNQLHQYAYGLLLAKKVDAELYIDSEFLTNYSKKLNVTFRDLEINKFDIHTEYYKSILSNQIVLSILKRLKISKLFDKLKFNIISAYIPLKELANRNVNFYYLDGIMGLNTDYQEDIPYLLENVKINEKFFNLNNQVKEIIEENNSVAIHIRRTDYLKAGSIHHVLNLDYYNKAIQYIESKIDNPTFYIFSDDNKFAKENFIGKNFKIIDYSGENAAFFDFLAIKNCQHYIIANSTFSWWAAFMGYNDKSITISPAVCLITEELDLKATYPKQWLIF
jgi:hypothetical protein